MAGVPWQEKTDQARAAQAERDQFYRRAKGRYPADTKNEVAASSVFGLVTVEGTLVKVVTANGVIKDERVRASIVETPDGEMVFAGRVAETPITMSIEQMERTRSGLVVNVRAALAADAAKIRRRAKK